MEGLIYVENHGSIVLFRPMGEMAGEWLQDHTDGMWFGGALVVEPRYVGGLAAGAQEDGLVVRAG